MAAVTGTVEVQKDAKSRTWYIGHIVEVVSEHKVLIGFDCEGWPNAEYPVSRIRKEAQPSADALVSFRPGVGDEVEMRTSATEYAPASWASATVRDIKESFYMMRGGPGGDVIVVKDQLRPKTDTSTVNSLSHEPYSLPPSLVEWASSGDAAGCFTRIEDQAGLFHIGVSGKSLRLLGNKKAIQRARMLLEVHLKHQSQIQSFQDIREKRLQALEDKRSRIEGHGFKNSVEFKVAASFVARIIGTRGENITAVQERHGVSIRIMDGKDDEEKTVRIFGNDAASVAKAREEVEFVEHPMTVETEMKRWVLGTNGKTINLFKDLAGLSYATLDRNRRELLLCGTKHCVDDAVAMFETHMMYHSIVNEMDETMEQILTQLEEYGDRDSRWEWSSWRDDFDKEYDQKLKDRERKANAAAKRAKAQKGSKGANGKGDSTKAAPAENEGSKQKAGGKKKEKAGKATEKQKAEEEAWGNEEQWTEPEPKERKRPGKTNKAAQKTEAESKEESDPKKQSNGGGRQWRPKADETETAEPPATLGRRERIEREKPDRERPAAGTRRMGKNGVRKTGAEE